MVEEKTEMVRMARSEVVVEAVVNGRMTPVIQEDTWNEEEEVMTGHVCNLGGQYCCALTMKPISDKESEYAKKSRPRRLYQSERLGVRRLDKILPN